MIGRNGIGRNGIGRNGAEPVLVACAHFLWYDN